MQINVYYVWTLSFPLFIQNVLSEYYQVVSPLECQMSSNLFLFFIKEHVY